jgi:hypothetical protein
METLLPALQYALHAFGFVLFLIVGGIGAASITDLWSFCLGDPHKKGEPKGGRIFSALGKRFDAGYMAFEQTTQEIRAAKERAAKNARELVIARSYTRVNPFKMMGLCQRCTNLWITAASFIPMHVAGGMSWWWFPIMLGISNVALSKIASLR